MTGPNALKPACRQRNTVARRGRWGDCASLADLCAGVYLESRRGPWAADQRHRNAGLELAAVGSMLVVAGDEEALAPYRSTQATLIVDNLDDCHSLLTRAGAQVLRGPQQVPTGRNLTARLPGGIQIEYVEWDRAQWDRVGGQEPPAATGSATQDTGR
jgi:hypothetical protein